MLATGWISERLLSTISGDQIEVIYAIQTGDEIDLLRGYPMSVRSVCKLQYNTWKFHRNVLRFNY